MGKLILVVDDDEMFRTTVCDVLSDAGYRTVAVADGLEALAYLYASAKPCLILLDLMMPNMDGWQFRIHQQSDPVLSKICTAIMTAGHPFPQKIQADHFLTKPVRLEEVLRVARECCGGDTG